MSRLTRYTQYIFGSTASSNQIAEFGSLAASAPATYSGATITPAIIQTLGNYLEGWFGAVIGQNSPAIEDMNALCYLFAYQLTYLMQAGVPEYDNGTNYFINDLAASSGRLYRSLTDNNIGNSNLLTPNWCVLPGNVTNTTISYGMLLSDSIVRADATSGALIMYLPPIVITPLGFTLTIKKIDTTPNFVAVVINPSDPGGVVIDGVTSYNLENPYDSITVVSNASTWDII